MDEDKFVAAIERKFRAFEVSARSGIEPIAESSPSPPTTSSPPPRRCHLCQRSARRLIEGAGGLLWCPATDAATCTRIAQSRLGASAGSAGSDAALKGALEPDSKCRDCGAEIRWVKTQRGKKMPVDVIPAPKDVAAFELVGRSNTMAFYISEKRRAMHFGDVYESHFQTCTGR